MAYVEWLLCYIKLSSPCVTQCNTASSIVLHWYVTVSRLSTFTVTQGDSPFGDELIAFVRLLTMPEEELKKWEEEKLTEKQIKEILNRKVWTQGDQRVMEFLEKRYIDRINNLFILFTRCQLLQLPYKTTIEVFCLYITPSIAISAITEWNVLNYIGHVYCHSLNPIASVTAMIDVLNLFLTAATIHTLVVSLSRPTVSGFRDIKLTSSLYTLILLYPSLSLSLCRRTGHS